MRLKRLGLGPGQDNMWKTNRDRKKLEKRAEKNAEACIAVALYSAEEAEVAILEAVAARKDADEAS